MSDMLAEYKPNRPLRSLGSSQLEIPRVHTKQGSPFSYYAARSWNQLPEEIRCAKMLATFKARLKTHLFRCAFVEWALCYWTDCTYFTYNIFCFKLIKKKIYYFILWLLLFLIPCFIAVIIIVSYYFTSFYVNHFELPLCMKCAIQINLPCLLIFGIKVDKFDPYNV